MRTILGTAATITLVMLLTSCGTSSGSSGSTKSSGTSGSSGGSVPAVGSATDLHKAPVPSPGGNPPPTHLVTKDLVMGTGTQAGTTGTVEVQYVGANYADGKVFDSSWQRGQSASFPLTGVIKASPKGSPA